MLSSLTGIGPEFTYQLCFQRDLFFFFSGNGCKQNIPSPVVSRFTKQKAMAFPSAVCPTNEDLALCISVSK